MCGRKNERFKPKAGLIIRNLSVLTQRKDLPQKWKDSISYGNKRWWVAETIFSSIKRTFGEYLYSVKFKIWHKKYDAKDIIV